jgi:muconolactone D-isomerase
MEFLVTMTTQVPAGTSVDVVGDVRRREAAHSRDLAEQGLLLRLWRPPVEPDEWRTLGLFSGENGEQLEKTLASMPLRVWRSDEVTPLAPHPNDPAPEHRASRASRHRARKRVSRLRATRPHQHDVPAQRAARRRPPHPYPGPRSLLHPSFVRRSAFCSISVRGAAVVFPVHGAPRSGTVLVASSSPPTRAHAP